MKTQLTDEVSSEHGRLMSSSDFDYGSVLGPSVLRLINELLRSLQCFRAFLLRRLRTDPHEKRIISVQKENIFVIQVRLSEVLHLRKCPLFKSVEKRKLKPLRLGKNRYSLTPNRDEHRELLQFP